MKLPPKQMACSVGHFLQSPGLSMEPKENDVFGGQSIHLINIKKLNLLSWIGKFLSWLASSNFYIKRKVYRRGDRICAQQICCWFLGDRALILWDIWRFRLIDCIRHKFKLIFSPWCPSELNIFNFKYTFIRVEIRIPSDVWRVQSPIRRIFICLIDLYLQLGLRCSAN